MVKMPKEITTHCPFCNTHRTHELRISKKKKASELKWGQRQFRRVTAGYRGYPRPLPSHEKSTKKKDLRLFCKTCKKSHIKKGYRAKKFEITR